MARHAAPILEAPETMVMPVIVEGTVPEISPETLGGPALRAAVEVDSYERNAEYFTNTGAPEQGARLRSKAQEKMAQVEQMLDQVRNQLAETQHHDLADAYLGEFPGLVNVFRQAKQHGAPHASIASWLADKHGANDGILLTFLEEHIDKVAREQQSSETRLMVETARAEYVQAAEKAIEHGWFSEEARPGIDKARKAAILVGDVWETHIVGTLGYHMIGQDYIVVGRYPKTHLNRQSKYELMETTTHELDHLAFPNEKTEARWDREAWAEHNTQCLMMGEWEVLNPDRRQNDSGIYAAERRLMHALLSGGRTNVGVALATRAHSSSEDSPEWKAFDEAIDNSWGRKNMFAWADDRIQFHEQALRGDGPVTRKVQEQAIGEVIAELYRLDIPAPQHRPRGAHRMHGRHRKA